MPIRPPHIRALRQLRELGPSTLRRWKRAHRKRLKRRLRSEIVARLWARGLVEFGWFTDRYEINDDGQATLGRQTPDLFAEPA